MKTEIIQGDVLTETQKLSDNIYCGILSDPPYALTSHNFKSSTKNPNGTLKFKNTGRGFMGKTWDAKLPSPEVFAELLRVCKPGAYGLFWAGARTQHRLICNAEDGGWIVRDSLIWLHGQGFPKGNNISKSIDKMFGCEREVIGFKKNKDDIRGGNFKNDVNERIDVNITLPASDQAKLWDGYNTALKPAHEVIALLQKPLDGTYAANCLKWGCGALNVDACRVGSDKRINFSCHSDSVCHNHNGYGIPQQVQGRYPPDVLLSQETAEEIGEPSRFYPVMYHAKPSSKERNAGCEELEEKFQFTMNDGIGGCPTLVQPPKRNTHPTLKSLAVNKWLATLIMPPEQRKLLVPYCGSGSEMIAAHQAGWHDITGIEMEKEYIDIAEARIKHWC